MRDETLKAIDALLERFGSVTITRERTAGCLRDHVKVGWFLKQTEVHDVGFRDPAGARTYHLAQALQDIDKATEHHGAAEG